MLLLLFAGLHLRQVRLDGLLVAFKLSPVLAELPLAGLKFVGETRAFLLQVGELLLCLLQLGARLVIGLLEVLALRDRRRKLRLHLFNELVLLLRPLAEVILQLLREMLVVSLDVLDLGTLLVQLYLQGLLSFLLDLELGFKVLDPLNVVQS